MLALGNFILNVYVTVLASKQELRIWGKMAEKCGSERGGVKLTFSSINIGTEL